MNETGSEPIGVAGQQPRATKRPQRRGGGPFVRRSFLLPSVLLLLALSIFPFVFSLALSVGSWVIGRAEPYQFLGATNFTRLFTDARYLDSLINTTVYTGGSLVIQFGLGLGLAWLLFLKPPGGRIYRVLFLMPMMLTPVAVAYMWRLMFEQRIG
ncbi:MAG: carbohydrate ABC transporter permease, partial [Actinomycetota bacterium]